MTSGPGTAVVVSTRHHGRTTTRTLPSDMLGSTPCGSGRRPSHTRSAVVKSVRIVLGVVVALIGLLGMLAGEHLVLLLAARV